MSLTLSIAGTAIAGAIAPSSIAAQSIASDGDVGFGGFVIDDPAASIVTTGHKSVTISESACSQPRLFTGYLTERDSGRSAERGMLIDDDRQHEAGLVDLNACLNFRHLRGTASDRPAETMGARLTWLLGTEQVSSFITGTAFATLYSNMMDAANYRGTYPRSVLDDLAGRRANLTYFVFWDPTGTAVSLYFGDDSTGIAESTLYVSNDPLDVNGTTVFPPDTTATLKRSPEEVYSEVTVRYAHGTKMLYRRRASTAAAYVDRGTVIDKPYTGSLSTAQGQAEAFLDKHAVEKDTISCTIIVPPDAAGLVTAGQRMNVKFTHLDDYTAWTSMRVVSVNVRPTNDAVVRYALDLVLELPRAGTGPALTCDGTVNGLAGIVPDEGDTNVPVLFGADGNGQIIQSPAYASDGNAGNPAFGGTFAFLDGGAYINHPTFIREFRFVLPETKGVAKVTVEASHNGAGIADVPSRGWTFYVKVGGTTYWAADYATINDFDVWDRVEYAPEGLQPDYVSTWDFGQTVETDSITFGMQSDGAYSEDYVPELDLFEIFACLGELDEEEEQVPTPTPAGTAVQTTTDPTTGDDGGDGYQVGQLWQNTTTNEWFILTDNTVGAAVWQSLSAPPMTLDDLTDVNVGTPANGDVLTWDSTPGEWIAAAVPAMSAASTVTDETTWGITPAVGTGTAYARNDHTHGSPADPVTGSAIAAIGFAGELLISDTPSTPLVFADILQNEAQADLIYADPT